MAVLAAFDVDIANEFGIPAALIFHEIKHLCNKSRREDGFCWKTTEEFKEDLALGEHQVRDAIKILVNAGIIETKNTYITGTQKKCRHFRITDEGFILVRDIAYAESHLYKMYKSEQYEMYTSTYIESSKQSSKHINTDSENMHAFEEAWSHMPKKAGKEPAKKHFLKAIKDGVKPADIVDGAKAYEKFCSETGREKRYTLNGSTWFSQRRWEDDLGDPSTWQTSSEPGLIVNLKPKDGGEGWLPKKATPDMDLDEIFSEK